MIDKKKPHLPESKKRLSIALEKNIKQAILVTHVFNTGVILEFQIVKKNRYERQRMSNTDAMKRYEITCMSKYENDSKLTYEIETFKYE